MIQLMFKRSTEIFGVTVDKGKVFWSWARFNEPLQYLPQCPLAMKIVIKKVKESRNMIPHWFISAFCDIPADEMEEFKNAKTDNELRDIVISNCKRNQCELIEETVDGVKVKIVKEKKNGTGK